MAKRTWSESQSAGDADAIQAQQQLDTYDQDTKSQPRKQRAMSSATNGNGTNGAGHDAQMPVPQISRKIKACASCRRHKIKCLMDESGPPCRRCAERNLGCVLTKNLQSIIDEKSQYSEAIVQDLEHMHAALKDLVAKAGMPDIPPLQSASLRDSFGSPTNDDNSAVMGVSNQQIMGVSRQEENGPSCDNSPKISPDDEGLPYVPIHSLYALTKMRALRSPEETQANQQNSRGRNISDFITRGSVKLEDAERLFALYRDRLDPFMYGVGCRYRSLDELRRRSTVLTAATLTVAALHDPRSDHTYGQCSSEFKRLMEKSMFERRVDRDYLRAMCVASYWLSDMSWMLSGYAIRRAAECNLHTSHARLLNDPSEEAADCARLWYILYICDQHLATLYGRPSIVQEDASIQGWEAFLASPVSNDEDKRLASQVALLGILRSIRELFGPDNGQPIPRVYLNQIAHFNRQLDQWIGHWSNTLLENHHHIGPFPRKGAMLHFHFAKLHLYSHIFRGLPHDSPVPHYFMESATSAVSAALAILDFIRSDPDVAAGIVGMPSYLLSMTAFACMFLIKVSIKYGGDLIERERVYEVTTALVRQFRSLSTGKWHLANLMTSGLEKMVATLQVVQQPYANGAEQVMMNEANGMVNGMGGVPQGGDMFANVDGELFFDYGMSFGLSPVFGVDGTGFNMGTTPQVHGFGDVEYPHVTPQSG